MGNHLSRSVQFGFDKNNQSTSYSNTVTPNQLAIAQHLSVTSNTTTGAALHNLQRQKQIQKNLYNNHVDNIEIDRSNESKNYCTFNNTVKSILYLVSFGTFISGIIKTILNANNDCFPQGVNSTSTNDTYCDIPEHIKGVIVSPKNFDGDALLAIGIFSLIAALYLHCFNPCNKPSSQITSNDAEQANINITR